MNAIFFDRDGVVNERRIDDYVKTWEEFVFLPDIFDVLPLVHQAGYAAVVVSNQRGVARGLMSVDALEVIHAQMQDELHLRAGQEFDAIYYCPHEKGDGCDCRKPRPGMLLKAAAEHNIDLADSWMIGDSETDIEAGAAAGCRTARIAPEGEATKADVVGRSLREVWGRIQERTLADSTS